MSPSHLFAVDAQPCTLLLMPEKAVLPALESSSAGTVDCDTASICWSRTDSTVDCLSLHMLTAPHASSAGHMGYHTCLYYAHLGFLQHDSISG